MFVLSRCRRHGLLQLQVTSSSPLAGHPFRATQETLIMFKKLISGIIGAAFMLAVGTTAMVQNAHAAPWCYKTGPNTVQCTR